MKIVILLLIFGLFLMVGLKFSSKLKRKMLFYNSLCAFIEKCNLEISFATNKLETISNFPTSSPDFSRLITAFQGFVGGKLSHDKFISVDVPVLDDNEKKEVLNFFLSLGGLGKDEELKNLAYRKQNFDGKKRESEERYKKLGKAVIKLFVIFGLMAVIILI